MEKAYAKPNIVETRSHRLCIGWRRTADGRLRTKQHRFFANATERGAAMRRTVGQRPRGMPAGCAIPARHRFRQPPGHRQPGIEQRHEPRLGKRRQHLAAERAAFRPRWQRRHRRSGWRGHRERRKVRRLLEWQTPPVRRVLFFRSDRRRRMATCGAGRRIAELQPGQRSSIVRVVQGISQCQRHILASRLTLAWRCPPRLSRGNVTSSCRPRFRSIPL